MKLKQIVARNLRALRDKHGYSHAEIAKRARKLHYKLSPSAVNYMMQDDGREPTIGSIDAVAAVFHVPPEFLLDENFDPQSQRTIELTPEVLRIARHVSANLATMRTVLNPALIDPARPADQLITTQDLPAQGAKSKTSADRVTPKPRRPSK